MDNFNCRTESILRGIVADEIMYSNKEDRTLYFYKLLNSCSNSKKQIFYRKLMEEYLNETDYNYIIAEVDFGKFDNITLWINKTIKDIEEEYNCKDWMQKNFRNDFIKVAFCLFVEDLVLLHKNATYKLLNTVIETPTLNFLHSIVFYEKEYLKDIKEKIMDEDKRYLDLLDKNFSTYIYCYDSYDKIYDKESLRKKALIQRKHKRKRYESNSAQLELFNSKIIPNLCEIHECTLY